MPLPRSRTLGGGLVALTAGALAAGALAVTPAMADDPAPTDASPTAALAAPAAQDLFISEVHPDNGNPSNIADNFEFFEVTNTTDAPIDLGARGIGVSYVTTGAPSDTTLGVAPKFAVSDGVAGNGVTPGPLPVTVPAHGSTVFWLEYVAGTDVNTYTRSEADFRAFYGQVPAGTEIVRVEGQGGIANGGARGLGLVDVTATPTALSWSYLPERAPTKPGVSTHFRVPAAGERGTAVLTETSPTVGTVDPAQLTAAPGPTEPTPTEPTPTEPTPTEPTPTEPTPTEPTPTEPTPTEPTPTEPTPTEPTPTEPTPTDPTPTATEPTPTDPTPTATEPTPTESTPTEAPSSLTAYDLFVSEIHPDNGTPAGGGLDDNFEFFEVTNTTDAPIDLDAHHLGVSYVSTTAPTDAALSASAKFALSDGVKGNAVPTGATLDVTVPAHGSTVFWLEYATSATLDTYARTEADFRAFYGDVPAGTEIVRVEGQGGIANGGARALGLVDLSTPATPTALSWSYLPARASNTPGVSAHLTAPAAGQRGAQHLAEAAPTPGAIDAAQLPHDDPDPTDPPTTTPPTTPPGPDVPAQGPPPATDPSLTAPVLQITEVAPDTANVGGGDGYEFIEVYNGSDQPVDFGDFTINYLYTDANEVTTNSALWPAVPADPVIAPGRTLVLWIKNTANGALTAADFNAHFGAHLTAGKDLVEITSGGMANGGLRGIQVMTNTGYDVSRAYYLNDADTVADQPLQYRWDATAVDPAKQVKVGTGTATPGYAAPDQVPAGLVATPSDTTAPAITDLTGGTETPDTEDLALEFEVTDEHQVRTVALTLETDVTEPSTRHLRFGAPDRYAHTVPAVDLYGKRWVEYTLTTSDGRQTRTLGPKRILLAEGEEAPVRLNVTDQQYVGGPTRLSATTAGDPAELALSVDERPVAPTTPALEAAPVFAFEATNTDAFFRNGVRLGDEVLTVFDEGFYDRVETVTAPVPVEQVVQGQLLTVGIYAGTKAWPEPSIENNDDFAALNVRLALPDGRVLRPTSCAGGREVPKDATSVDVVEEVRTCAATPEERIAFSDANLVYLKATFTLPDDAFDSRAHTWDTTAVADGPHTVTATAGDRTLTRTVRVDNTRPSISPTVTDGQRYRGQFTIDATATDAGSGLVAEGVTATLDGAPVTLPLRTSSLELAPGAHEAVFTARDEVGNVTTRTVAFTTGDEKPATTLTGPDDAATLTAGGVELTATAGSPEGDALTMSFREGDTFVPTDAEVSAYDGTSHVALDRARSEKTVLTDQQLAQVAGTDGIVHEVSSDTELPYQLFTVAVPADAGADAQARLSWTGSANAGAKVLLYVRDVATGSWEEVARRVTEDDEPFTLEATVPTAGHTQDGKVTVLVQHSEGFAGEVRSTRTSTEAPYHPGATPRSSYDFTIGWESDTQYYNETDAYYPHQTAIHEFLLDQRDELNLQYLIHTGDIVNVSSEERQWHNADAAYDLLDEAGLPYGVLAGNHDVGHHDSDYEAFSSWFGKARFEDNPWYGGQLQDNRGHYDLISANGVDFLMLYMGWAPGDEQIAWMNDVIARYPERKVWINLHEFMLTTGGLGPIPQRIMDEVVATNPNVFAVSSGHYHDAYTRTDEFDDDGDGTADRTVYSMLFDYQGLPEGGLGYLRLLHFDNQGEKIVVRTYSPSLEDFDSDEPSLNSPPGMQDFEIPYADVDIDPVTKTLATDSFRADVLTGRQIAVLRDVPSGATRTVGWDVAPGEHGWFVETTNPYGGADVSEVRTVTVTAPGAPAAGQPAVRGTARVGSTVSAETGTWPAGTTYGFQWNVGGKPLAGATGATLALTPALAGQKLTVTVIGATRWSPSSSATSPAVTVVAGRLTGRKPVVTGKALVGRTLKVRAGTWGPRPVALKVRWFVGGKAVGGSKATLRLTRAMAGKKVSVKVTGTKPGYAALTKASRSTGKVRRR